jgi:Icc protein
VLCIPGNHDDPELMRAGLAGEPFRHCGHHDFGVWRIVMLDSTVPGDAAGEVSAAELARLEATLGEGCPPHALIVLHHQPVPVGSPGLDSVGLRNGPALLDVLARSTTARALLCGHVHQESERRAGALPAFSTPSTCVQFMPGSAGFAFDTRGPGCRSLELQDDGGVVTRVIWAD